MNSAGKMIGEKPGSATRLVALRLVADVPQKDTSEGRLPGNAGFFPAWTIAGFRPVAGGSDPAPGSAAVVFSE